MTMMQTWDTASGYNQEELLERLRRIAQLTAQPEVQPEPTPELPAAPPLPAPVARFEPTGRSVEEITGTDYVSPEERAWYLEQRGLPMPEVAPPPAPAPPPPAPGPPLPAPDQAATQAAGINALEQIEGAGTPPPPPLPPAPVAGPPTSLASPELAQTPAPGGGGILGGIGRAIGGAAGAVADVVPPLPQPVQDIAGAVGGAIAPVIEAVPEAIAQLPQAAYNAAGADIPVYSDIARDVRDIAGDIAGYTGYLTPGPGDIGLPGPTGREFTQFVARAAVPVTAGDIALEALGPVVGAAGRVLPDVVRGAALSGGLGLEARGLQEGSPLLTRAGQALENIATPAGRPPPRAVVGAADEAAEAAARAADEVLPPAARVAPPPEAAPRYGPGRAAPPPQVPEPAAAGGFTPEPPPSGLLHRLIANLPNELRQGVAGLDLSNAGRQAWGTIRHVEEYARAAASSARALTDESYALARNAELKTGQRPGLFLGDLAREGPAQIGRREENYAGELVGNAPLFRQSANANTLFLNEHRTGVYDRVYGAWQRAEQAAREGRAGPLQRISNLLKRPGDDEALGRYISRNTGRGTLGPAERTWLSDLLGFGLFSPRYTMSRLQGPASMFNIRNPRVAIEAVKDYAASTGATMSLLALAKQSGAADVNLDPTSSDFGKFRMGPVRIDPWAGHQQLATLFARLQEGAAGEGDFRAIATKLLTDQLRNKASPAAARLWDIIEGENWMGRPVSIDEFATAFLPIFIQGIYEGAKEGLLGETLATLPASFFGLGVNVYEPDPNIQRYQQYNQAREEAGYFEPGNETPAARANLDRANPQLDAEGWYHSVTRKDNQYPTPILQTPAAVDLALAMNVDGEIKLAGYDKAITENDQSREAWQIAKRPLSDYDQRLAAVEPNQRSAAGLKTRKENPHVDAWLYYWGRTTTFQSDEARRIYEQQIQGRYGGPPPPASR